MLVTINGEQRTIPDQLTLSGLVAFLELKPERLAIELNGSIQPRALWEATVLKEGDGLEIVHFVGGGESSNLESSQLFT